MTQFIVLASFALALCTIATITDIRYGTIPNWLTLPAWFVAMVLHGVWGGWMAVAISLLAAFLCMVIPLLMFSMGAMGGGDVKLFAALGAILGISIGIESQLFAFCAATFFSLATLAWKGKLWQTLQGAGSLLSSLGRGKDKRTRPHTELLTELRLGPAVLFGTAFTLLLRI